MSALARLFVNAGPGALAARLMACASACGLLAACVGDPFADAKVDPHSSVAAEVAKLARASADAPYPRFRDIPPMPKDLPAPREYGARAAKVDQARADLERDTAPGTWALGDTEAFAAQARQAAGPDAGPAATVDTEAFAQALRKRATPPPPTKR